MEVAFDIPEGEYVMSGSQDQNSDNESSNRYPMVTWEHYKYLSVTIEYMFYTNKVSGLTFRIRKYFVSWNYKNNGIFFYFSC